MRKEDTTCIKCGALVTKEELEARYRELSERGIVAMMVPMCAKCRGTDVKTLDMDNPVHKGVLKNRIDEWIDARWEKPKKRD